MKKDLYQYLVNEPRARERKFKDRGVVNVLINKPRYHELRNIDKETLVEFVREHETYMRSWRQILEKTPELRGKDYETKQKAVKNKLKELGYER